jgi:hypothetical protein
MRTHPAFVVLTLLVACGPFDAETRAHRAYVRQLQPLLVENSLLSDQVLGLAARAYNDPNVEPAALAEAWTKDVVPLSEHLHSQATFVLPPTEWATAHGELVEIWSDRAQAYRALSESITVADPDQWQAARELADTVKLQEEEWFRNTNQTLGPKGLLVDQYP